MEGVFNFTRHYHVLPPSRSDGFLLEAGQSPPEKFPGPSGSFESSHYDSSSNSGRC